MQIISAWQAHVRLHRAVPCTLCAMEPVLVPGKDLSQDRQALGLGELTYGRLVVCLQ